MPSESPPESPYEAPSEAPSSPPSTYSAYKPPLLPTHYTTTPKKSKAPAHKVKVKGKVAKDKGKDKGKEKGKDKVKAQPPKKLGPIPEYPGIGKKPLIKYGECTVYFSPPAEVWRVKPATGSRKTHAVRWGENKKEHLTQWEKVKSWLREYN